MTSILKQRDISEFTIDKDKEFGYDPKKDLIYLNTIKHLLLLV